MREKIFFFFYKQVITFSVDSVPINNWIKRGEDIFTVTLNRPISV